jgi:4-amino-4-deoxy-L-arabinose transferase-like glycosyltransferase
MPFRPQSNVSLGWDRSCLALAIISLMAISVRMLVLLRPGVAFAIFPDSVGYIDLAKGLRHGCGFARFVNGRCAPPELLRTPGYPLLLAVISNLRLVIILQALLWGAICFVLGRVVSTLWGKKAGLAAALLIAFDIPSIVTSAQILTDTLFTSLIVAAVLIHLFIIASNIREATSVWLGLLSGVIFGVAALVRPIGEIFVVLAPLPFLFATRLRWRRKIALAAAAFALPAIIIFAWMVRNELETGWFGESAIEAQDLYLYRAAGVLWYRHGSLDVRYFQEIQNRLRDDLCSKSASYCNSPDGYREMRNRGIQICSRDLIALVVISLASFVYVSITPYSSELYSLLNIERRKANSFAHRYEEILETPVVAAATATCAAFLIFLWIGVILFLSRLNSKPRHLLALYPLAIGLSMIALSAGPQAVDFRFRVPSLPFLALVAAVGWFGTTRPSRIDCQT